MDAADVLPGRYVDRVMAVGVADREAAFLVEEGDGWTSRVSEGRRLAVVWL